MDGYPRSCWSELSSEILDLVLKRLGLPDYLNFGKVCTSWRSVFLGRCNLSRPPPCMLVFPTIYRYSTSPYPSKLPLWGLYRGRFQKLLSPVLEFLPGEKFVGSSMGWLVLASEEKPGMQLMNPTSKERISPPLLVSGGQMWWSRSSYFNSGSFLFRDVFLSSDPTSSDCIIVATGRSLAWCRLGDLRWTIFPASFTICIKDVVFHKGDMYACDHEGDILAFTFNPRPKMTNKVFITDCTNLNLSKWRLVESDGDVLAVAYHRAKGCSRSSADLYVFKKCDDSQWVRVESLGDRVLLIGNDSSGTLSFSTQDLMGSGFEANNVYYHVRGNPIHLVKFSMADGSKKRIRLPNNGDVTRGLTMGLTTAWITTRSW